jgi:hypothetical protein
MPAPYFSDDITTKLLTHVAPESGVGTVDEGFREGMRKLVSKETKEYFGYNPKTGFVTDGALRGFLVNHMLGAAGSDSLLRNRITVWVATLTA